MENHGDYGEEHTGIITAPPPKWCSLSHHARYRRLEKVRRVWCRRRARNHEYFPGRVVHLEGAWINDVPSFYLALGEAINGPNGYFGGCLDALSDCLNGGFGVLPSLTICLSRFDTVRSALDGQAWCRFRAESFLSICAEGDSKGYLAFADYTGSGYLYNYIVEADHLRELAVDIGYLGDGSDADVALWTARYESALADEPFDHDALGSYFDSILEVMERGSAQLIPDEEGACL